MKTILTFLLSFTCVLFMYSQEFHSELDDYLHHAQYQKAIEYIDKQQPTKELLSQKAFCYKTLRNYPKAIEILESLSQEYPMDISVKLDLATCYESVAKHTQGISCYDELIKMDSTNMYFHIQKADLLYQSEKYQPALDIYSQIDGRLESGYLNKRLGMCFEKLNQSDSAKVYFTQALEIDSTDSYSAVSLVKLYIKQEDYMNALIHSEAFIWRDSTNAQMNFLNAFTYYSADDYRTAAERFEKCRAKGDSSLMVNRGLGISYYFLKDSKRAQPYLHLAYEQDTTNNVVLHSLALTSCDLGYYRDAINYYKTLMKREIPGDAKLYMFFAGLSSAFEGEGEYGNAISNYSRALQYADMYQKMELTYKIAQLCEEKLQDYLGAYNAYKQYRVSLFNCQTNSNDSTEIQSIDERLALLDKHIEFLKEKSNEQFGIGKNIDSTVNIIRSH